MVRFRLQPGPIPLHHQVYLDLRGAIEAGDWGPGDRLPPERELASRYGCSLITVRRALTELAREGRITRTRGRGTFVTRPRIERDLLGAASFAEEMQARGLRPETRVLRARVEPAGEAVAEALSLAPAAPVVFLERLRLADAEPLLLERVRLPADRLPGLLDEDLEHRSLYEVLAVRYGCIVARTRETIEPVLLGRRDADLLGQPPERPALLLEGVAFTAADAPVEHSLTFVRGDRTKFRLETATVRDGIPAKSFGLTAIGGGRR